MLTNKQTKQKIWYIPVQQLDIYIFLYIYKHRKLKASIFFWLLGYCIQAIKIKAKSVGNKKGTKMLLESVYQYYFKR